MHIIIYYYYIPDADRVDVMVAVGLRSFTGVAPELDPEVEPELVPVLHILSEKRECLAM
jgi:hypothetical protein